MTQGFLSVLRLAKRAMWRAKIGESNESRLLGCEGVEEGQVFRFGERVAEVCYLRPTNEERPAYRTLDLTEGGEIASLNIQRP